MQKNVIKGLMLVLALLSVYFVGKRIMGDQEVEREKLVTEKEEDHTSLPEGFHEFYDQFHTDSTYQMEHITFPLAGHQPAADSSSALAPHSWQAESWKLHKPFNDFGGTFTRTFTNYDGIVTEMIDGSNGAFRIVKRYAILNGEWHLIYYQSLSMTG